MCKCDPSIRTPFCGKPGCEWPKQVGEKVTRCVTCNSEKQQHFIRLENGYAKCDLCGGIQSKDNVMVQKGFYSCY